MQSFLIAAALALAVRAAPLADSQGPFYIESGRIVLAGPLLPSPTEAPLMNSAILATTTVTIRETYTDTALIVAPLPLETAPARTRTVIKVVSRPTPASSTRDPRSYWTLPSTFSQDVSSAFGVKTWAWGSSLVTPLPSLPAMTSSVSVRPQKSARPSTSPSANTDPVLQVTYPIGSVNPGNKPQGGVGFYASPIDISSAKNVSFAYSLYFPPDFDFVKGGKLPGLYGGHGGCSGGQQSEDCFSTRLMYRKDGMGELYLYAPKGNQSTSLCSTPPTTYCDSTFGYSIGRGAWTWKRGQWSDVRQDIWLNTPGKQDGGFNIWVNGDLVLHSDSVMYRNAVQAKSSSKATAQDPDDGDELNLPTIAGDDTSSVPVDDTANAAADNGSDSGIVGDVEAVASDLLETTSQLGGIIKRDLQQDMGYLGPVQTRMRMGLAKLFPNQPLMNITRPSQRNASTSFPLGDFRILYIVGPAAVPAQLPLALPQLAAKTTYKTVTFLGMMFDTFFGGSDPSWASPREQHTYFNKVALWIKS